MSTYRIKDWNEHYENNRTRELKRLDWVPVPNRMDGDGYTELLDHPNGAAHLGAWLTIIQIASKCEPRGTLLREGGRPHDIHSLSRMSRVPSEVFKEVLPRLRSIGWLEDLTVRSFIDLRDGSQEGAGIPQDDAGKSQEGALEGKGMEGNGNTNPPAADAAAADDALFLVKSEPPKVSGQWIADQHDKWYYGAYWNRKDRETSRKAYAKRIKALISEKGLTPEDAAAFIWNAAIADKERFQHTEDWTWRQNLHPATWLNGARWEDQPRARDSPSGRRERSFVADVEAAMARSIQETGKPW